ncbi:MAG: hypothetical protein AAFX78_10145 [Cyanobacteria bacterium J06638_20]
MNKRYRVRCHKRGRSPRMYDSVPKAAAGLGVHKSAVYKALDEGRTINGWKLSKVYPETQDAKRELRRAQVTTDAYMVPDPVFGQGMTVYHVDPKVVSAIARNTPAGQIPDEYRAKGAA